MDLQSPRPVATVRRNPPRKAKQSSSTRALSPSKPSNEVTGITPFPLDEFFDSEMSQIHPILNQKPQKSNNLKVFLRIRPLENFAGGVAKAQGRARFAKEEERKNISCLFVNSSSSVTLNGPSTAFQSKRAKNEVYDGFSHVFAPQSVQEDIYAKVMQPLVMDFMEGHSSLLVAMGPTGSGKTYTMFGSQQQLGIVPLALRQIFSQTADNENIAAYRMYYLSMFEIHSERGKGEKIFDLFPEPTSHKQASFGCFNEVRISSFADAEKLVAHGIFKRSTAPTLANNQSSRSQCIINVRCILKSDKDDHSFTNAVLTIADLAGAERERKTGNQGTRLLESNFINNTSMVFGQCLRSLLEHQKNPKKPIEKHFKNSLLTRYLQDYMEGKKQMTLILTVKAGQEDYMDTSFILRQASPYMKIKFYHLQENNNAPCLKRKNTLFITERSKRRKAYASEVSLIDGVHVVMDVAGVSKMSEKDSIGEEICTQNDTELHVELQKIKRREEVMTNFARALLSTLKQYKDKLKESENKVRYLNENLKKQTAEAKEMEKELNEIRNLRSCPIGECANVLSVNHGVSMSPILAVPDHMEHTNALPGESNTPLVDIAFEAYSSLPLEENAESRDQFLNRNTENYQEHTQNYVQIGKMDNLVKNLLDAVIVEGPHDTAPVNILLDGSECNGKTLNHLRCFPQPTVPPEGEGCILHLPGSEGISAMQEEKEQSEEKVTLTENVQQCAKSLSTEALKNEDDAALRPLNYERPKRKLLPASAIHFNDFNGLFMDENAMEIKRKKTANVKARSDGSISLIRIFQSNLPR